MAPQVEKKIKLFSAAKSSNRVNPVLMRLVRRGWQSCGCHNMVLTQKISPIKPMKYTIDSCLGGFVGEEVNI